MVGSGQPGIEVPMGSRVGKFVDPQNDPTASRLLTAVSSYSEGVLFTGEAFVQKAVLLFEPGWIRRLIPRGTRKNVTGRGGPIRDMTPISPIMTRPDP